jgi:hypothetical protein
LGKKKKTIVMSDGMLAVHKTWATLTESLPLPVAGDDVDGVIPTRILHNPWPFKLDLLCDMN